MDAGQGGNHARPVTSFGRLIREQREKRGMSLDAVVTAADRAGYSFTKSRLHQLELEPLSGWPKATIVKGLAAALVIPERVLTAALIESMGLEVGPLPDSDWQLIISRAEQLTPAGRRRLKRQIETLFDVNDEA